VVEAGAVELVSKLGNIAAQKLFQPLHHSAGRVGQVERVLGQAWEL